MEITLRGSSPCATTAAILLMTRARQLGLRLSAYLVGDPDDTAVVAGPALAHSPVLASCGVGRDLGAGGVIIVRGAPGAPLMVSLSPDGADGWFLVDRDGRGCHPATEGLVRMSADSRPTARRLARDLRRAMEALGMAPDPAILDILFGAPVSALGRLALALRAGRAISGLRGEPVTRYLSGHPPTDRDPIAPVFDREAFGRHVREGQLAWIFDGFSTSIRDRVEAWVEEAVTLEGEDLGKYTRLIHGLAEIASHLAQLPPHSILPPLPAHEDAVATSLKAALGADGDDNANAQLQSVFRFLGGRYLSASEHAHDLPQQPLPADPLGRWQWFCAEAIEGRKQADRLWPLVVDPPQ